MVMIFEVGKLNMVYGLLFLCASVTNYRNALKSWKNPVLALDGKEGFSCFIAASLCFLSRKTLEKVSAFLSSFLSIPVFSLLCRGKEAVLNGGEAVLWQYLAGRGDYLTSCIAIVPLLACFIVWILKSLCLLTQTFTVTDVVRGSKYQKGLVIWLLAGVSMAFPISILVLLLYFGIVSRSFLASLVFLLL